MKSQLLATFLIVILLLVYQCSMCSTSSVNDGKSLEFHLQKCMTFINLEHNEKRQFTQHFNKVYKYVTDSVGEKNDFFKKVFQRQQLAGSYADRIKVGKPNEYDALMILKFPDPVVSKSRPGFVKINIKDGLKKWSNIDEQKYKPLIDQNGYLLQDKVLSWLRALIYEIVNQCNNVIIVDRNQYRVAKSSNGPAVTLDVTIMKSENGTTGKFSIDFVGGMAFDFKQDWFADFRPPIIQSKNWNAVAKPNKLVSNKNLEWICSYADIEREYLHGTNTLKQLIRIFKKIRDTHNLTNLKSYYIKVMFLHQRREQPSNDYWKRQLGVLFLEMFDVILKHLDKRKLVSFWHKQNNLFGDLTTVQVTDIYNKLKKIRENINKSLTDKNPAFIYTTILPKKEAEKLLPATINGTCKVLGIKKEVP